MRISHKHKFIFLAVPRTASTTIRNILDAYSDIRSIHITKTDNRFPYYHHISAREVKNIFDKKGLDYYSYKRFCVVRNPYSRVVSLYHHHKKINSGHDGARGLTYNLKKYIRSLFGPEITFKDYAMSIDPTSRLTTGLREFICDEEGNFLVEDILKFETLQSELPAYLENLGIIINPGDIPHLNASKSQLPYKTYYDSEAEEYISEIYDYEMKTFGYKLS